MKWLFLIGTMAILPVMILTGYILLKLFLVNKNEYTDFE